MEKQLDEKWTVKAGLRYEYSTISGNSSSGQSSDNSYGKFFPTAYLTYKVNDDNTFNINYSKRINRPGFRALNPFRWYTNINSYYSGNPALNPSVNNNFELSYLYKGKFSISTYFQREVNAFAQLVMQQKVGTLSGGQRARVAIAQCLLLGAAVIVLDQPTNHLDITSTPGDGAGADALPGRGAGLARPVLVGQARRSAARVRRRAARARDGGDRGALTRADAAAATASTVSRGVVCEPRLTWGPAHRSPTREVL